MSASLGPVTRILYALDSKALGIEERTSGGQICDRTIDFEVLQDQSVESSRPEGEADQSGRVEVLNDGEDNF